MYGNFDGGSKSKSQPVSTENLFETHLKSGKRCLAADIEDFIGLSVSKGQALSTRICRKCATKVRNAAPTVALLRAGP